MQYKYLIKKYQYMAYAIVFIVLGLVLYFYKADKFEEDIFFEEGPKNPEISQEEITSTNNELVVVDVAGAINNPSVYVLDYGSRTYEVIEMAGGLRPDADTTTVNLASVLEDGTKLYIPTKDEIVNENLPIIGSISNNNGLININTADSSELQKLSGVGPSTADKIISYRQDYGRFNKIEDLMNVSGIGEKTFEKLKSHIRVN